jgi:hypothetical protein
MLFFFRSTLSAASRLRHATRHMVSGPTPRCTHVVNFKYLNMQSVVKLSHYALY